MDKVISSIEAISHSTSNFLQDTECLNVLMWFIHFYGYVLPENDLLFLATALENIGTTLYTYIIF